jgi:hypothetical protein
VSAIEPISAALFAHELSHCGAYAHYGPALITRDETSAVTWSRGSPPAINKFISVLAGPFTDVVLRRGWKSPEHWNVSDLLHLVLTTPCDSADEDAARARRMLEKIDDPVEAAEQALILALVAARLETMNPVGFALMLQTLNDAPANEGLLVGKATIDDLVEGRIPEIITMQLTEYLENDDAGVEAARIETMEILDEWQRTGLIVGGKLTPTAMLLLGD